MDKSTDMELTAVGSQLDSSLNTTGAETSPERPSTPEPTMYRFISNCRIENGCVREFLSEFIATFVLMMIGESSMAYLVLKKQHDIFAVVFCWGIAVMFGLMTGASNSGGHINPCVTTALATIGKFPWKKVPHYVLGQHLGAFAACALLYINYVPLLDAYDSGVRTTLGENATGIVWTTFPDANVPTSVLVLDTIICSAMLLFGILVVLDKDNAGVPAYMHGFYIGLLVIAVCWAMGGNAMAAINPARDFPPRVLAALVGYENTFSYRNFWWIPMFVTHFGATVGCYMYELFIGIHKPPKRAPIADIAELKEYTTENPKM